MSWLFPDTSGMARLHANYALEFHRKADELEFKPDIERWRRISKLSKKKKLTKREEISLMIDRMAESNNMVSAKIYRSLAYEQENMLNRM